MIDRRPAPIDHPRPPSPCAQDRAVGFRCISPATHRSIASRSEKRSRRISPLPHPAKPFAGPSRGRRVRVLSYVATLLHLSRSVYKSFRAGTTDRGAHMTLRIGDTAPDFEANTTEGPIKFHEWIGDSWAVLFSHPKDFTPVCTTELGYMAKIKPEFDRRNTKIIGLSVDPVDKHHQWSKDIEETQGAAMNYPAIGDD